jgi:hypothetical protein
MMEDLEGKAPTFCAKAHAGPAYHNQTRRLHSQIPLP